MFIEDSHLFNNKKLSCEFDQLLIWSFDVNSMYPSIMYEGVPYGYVTTDPLEFKKPLKWFRCVMSFCEWKEKYASISSKPLPLKFLEGYFWIDEKFYQTIQRAANTDIQIKETYFQQMGKHMSKAIGKLYSVKCTTKNSIEKAGCKLMMNCLYGKLVEQVYIDKTLYSQEAKDFLTYKKEPSTIRYRQVLSGVYVINRARDYLLNLIMDEIDQGNEFLYCDTDSITLICHKKPLFKICSTTMKALKSEGKFTTYMNQGKLKKYYKYNKYTGEKVVKLSGIKNKVVKQIEQLTHKELVEMFDINNNVLVINGSNSRYDTEKDKLVVITDRDIVLREGIPHTHIFKEGKLIKI